jgi:hypothetical protein
MGNAKFWYYPGAALHEIDLGEGLSDLHVTPLRTHSDVFTMNGGMFRQTQDSKLQCRIILDRFTSKTVAAELESMMAHLELGGIVSFSADADKAVAAYLTTTPGQGDTTIRHGNGKNLFSVFNSSAALSAGDYVCVQNGNPGLKREYSRILTQSNLLTTLTDAVRYDYPTTQSTLYRYRDFYPVLKMPEDAMNTASLTSDHRISYTLDLVMIEDTQGLQVLAEYTDESTFADSSVGSIDSGSYTIDGAIEAYNESRFGNAVGPISGAYSGVFTGWPSP